ncbi:MAG: hypothetical protein ABSG33_03060 [Candidatus Bathyarchaeia archaeon]|jgi:MFS family permease
MGARSRNKQRRQETLSSETKIIVIGLVVAIIGSVIASSYQKATLTNYAGFGMLLAGISVLIFGTCATACATVNDRFAQFPAKKAGKPRMLALSIWTIGIGLILSIIGSILSSNYAKNSFMNVDGFRMLLVGICFFVLGIFGTLLGTLQANLNRNRRQAGLRGACPRSLSSSILSIGVGLALIIVGSIVAGSAAKETITNYTGFGMLLVGIATLTLGMSGTAVTIVKSILDLNKEDSDEGRPVLGSIWAIGIGVMLLIIGSLIAGSYAKTTTMNYSGFGLMLSGTGIFVYGLFETARFSAMGYLSGRWAGNREKSDSEPRARNFWGNIVKSTAVLNLAGVMVAMGLLFFSLWQLDLIVSGPVWWQSPTNPYGAGWSWPGPGAYAKDRFQCFLWVTTVGQAYDTLFMLIFISFIILFASAFFWPRSRGNLDLAPKPKSRSTTRNPKTTARRSNAQKSQPTATESTDAPPEKPAESPVVSQEETPQSPVYAQEDDGALGGT